MSPALCAILSASWLFAIIGYYWWRDTARISRIGGLLQAGGVLVDIGTPGQYAIDHAPAALNIPAEKLALRQGELGPCGRVVLVYGRNAFRSAEAAQMLRGVGFQSVTNIGTLRRWRARTDPMSDAANHRIGYDVVGGVPGALAGAALGGAAGFLGVLAGALVGGIAGAMAGAFLSERLLKRVIRTRSGLIRKD